MRCAEFGRLPILEELEDVQGQAEGEQEACAAVALSFTHHAWGDPHTTPFTYPSLQLVLTHSLSALSTDAIAQGWKRQSTPPASETLLLVHGFMPEILIFPGVLPAASASPRTQELTRSRAGATLTLPPSQSLLPGLTADIFCCRRPAVATLERRGTLTAKSSCV